MIVRTIKHGLAVARNALETYNAKLSSSMCDFTVVTKRSGFRAQTMEYGECVRIDRQSTICEPVEMMHNALYDTLCSLLYTVYRRLAY
jgi:hypothetical protein